MSDAVSRDWLDDAYDRLPESRAEAAAELDRLCKLMDGFTEAARRRLLVATVRCPSAGCVLAQVYEFALRNGGRRYVMRGQTPSGTPKNGLLNWAYSVQWHAPVYYSLGCRHGLAKLGRGWLLECVAAIQIWKHAMETEEQFLAKLPPELARGRKSRVFHPPGEAWT